METPSVIWAALREPFPEDHVEWRLAQVGKKRSGEIYAKVLAYITSRHIMDRFDSVLGVENWTNRFENAPNDPSGSSVICTISVRLPGTTEWISKCDVGVNSDIEPAKGGCADALKRAAVLFGCGRFLYDLSEMWAVICDRDTDGARYASSKIKVDGKDEYVNFYWLAPRLPSWAVKQSTPQPRTEPPPASKPVSTDPPAAKPAQAEGDASYSVAAFKALCEAMRGATDPSAANRTLDLFLADGRISQPHKVSGRNMAVGEFRKRGWDRVEST